MIPTDAFDKHNAENAPPPPYTSIQTSTYNQQAFEHGPPPHGAYPSAPNVYGPQYTGLPHSDYPPPSNIYNPQYIGPPYSNYPASSNIHGPQYMGSRQMPPSSQPIIIMQQPQQERQLTQYVTVQNRTSDGVCCLICLLTGGLSIPCWIGNCLGCCD